MSKYKLKVPLRSINIETWQRIVNNLHFVGFYDYVIEVNDPNTFSWYYKKDFSNTLEAIQKSSHYIADDEYVLINTVTENIVSGNGEYILEKIEKSMEHYVDMFLAYVNSRTIPHYPWMDEVFEEI